MFAILVLEREPMRWESLPQGIISWILSAGGFAAAALLIWLLAHALRTLVDANRNEEPIPWLSRILWTLVGGAVLAAVPLGLYQVWTKLDWTYTGPAPNKPGQTRSARDDATYYVRPNVPAAEQFNAFIQERIGFFA